MKSVRFSTAAWLLAAGLVLLPLPAAATTLSKAVFSGGCFWGVEAVFERLKGVSQAVSGYTGGTMTNPDYESVSSGQTGHAESVEVTYDAEVVSYDTLLKVYFLVAHDPTQLNYQGPDYGTQYRSAVWYGTPAQKALIEAAISKLKVDKTYKDPIVTEVKPLTKFWVAEDYHQDFIKKNPTQGYIVRFDLPKLRFLERNFATLVKP
ncbi:MAG: peptide-methionine (S)-S-oxide reductase MsrA [Spirochaetales bacterium]